jgi:hypothetical protein
VSERTDVDATGAGRVDAPVDPALDVGADGEGNSGPGVPVGPLEVDPPRPTGDARVDGALSTLSRVGDLPTEAHGPVYEDVHRGLRDTLAALDR